MIKKFLLLSLVASQLMVSCSSDDSPETDPTTDPTKELTLEEEIANIVKQPYSNLTPAQQKVKLEAEANDMLVQLDKTKSSGAIEAIINLGKLLDLNSVDIFNGKNGNEVEDILNVSDVYGIYTWSNAQKIWLKTNSTTELKFVFPAKASQTANNAVFSAKSVSSTIKVNFTDTSGNWSYDDEIGEWIQSPTIDDQIFLPTSSDATLTIDNTQAATFSQTAKYANGKEVPTDFAYKMTLNDGYTWEMSSLKAVQNTGKASLTYNGKTLIEFNAGSNSDIDKLIDSDELVQYRGKANGWMKLIDNFIIVADMDLATAAADDAALEKSVVYPEYPANAQTANANYKAYYTAQNTYNLKHSEGTAANFNKNMKLILISKKDGTKIADIVQHSVKDDYSYTIHLPVWVADEYYENGGYWSNWENNGEEFTRNYYTEVDYLKFNDNTEVEMSVYFSEGFSSFEAKFEEFVKAFEKK